MDWKSQVEDLIARVSRLEQRDRKYGDDILLLNKENYDLRKKLESSERKYETLQKKFESLGKVGSGDRDLSKPAERNVVCPNKKIIEDLRQQVTEMVKWKTGRTLEHEQVLEKIRTVARQTASIDAIEDQLGMLNSWKETKEADDEARTKRWDEGVKKINSNFNVLRDSIKERPQEQATSMPQNLQAQLVKAKNSIFCAELGLCRPFREIIEMIKVNNTIAAYSSNTGPFDSQSGTFKPQEDGAYHFGWKIHQKGDGKIRYIMAIDGMQGRIYLGYTEAVGDMCSGMLVVPLKKEQRVWIEAKRVAGPDATIYACNFMGWLLETNPLGSLESITKLQLHLFSPIVSECQHI